MLRNQKQITYQDLKDIYNKLFNINMAKNEQINFDIWGVFVELNRALEKVEKVQNENGLNNSDEILKEHDDHVIKFINTAINFCKEAEALKLTGIKTNKSFVLDRIKTLKTIIGIEKFQKPHEEKTNQTPKAAEFSPKKLWPKMYMFSSPSDEKSLDDDEVQASPKNSMLRKSGQS